MSLLNLNNELNVMAKSQTWEMEVIDETRERVIPQTIYFPEKSIDKRAAMWWIEIFVCVFMNCDTFKYLQIWIDEILN